MTAARSTALLRVILALLLAAAVPSLADARSGWMRHHTAHTTGTTTGSVSATHGHEAGGSQHVGAASEEIDKVLDGKIKNICRGC